MVKTHYWGIALLIVSSIVLKTNISPKNYREILFLVFTLFSLSSFKGSPRSNFWYIIPLAFLGYSVNNPYFPLNMVLLSCGVLLIGHLKDLDWDAMKGWIAGLAALHCFAVLLQYNGIDHASLFGLTRVIKSSGEVPAQFPIVGLLEAPMVSGSLMAMTFPFTLTRRFWPIAIVSLFCMHLIGSAMAFFSLLGCMLFFVSKIKSSTKAITATLLLLVCVGAGCLLYIDLPFLNPHERFKVWEASLYFVKNPLLGEGLGHFQHYFSKVFKFNELFKHPHNEFVSVYVSMGIVGLLAVLMPLANLFLRNWRKDLHFSTCLLIFLLNSIGAFPLHITSTALLFVLCVARLNMLHTKDFGGLK